MSILENIAKALIACDEAQTPKLVEQALAEGLEAKQILNEGLLTGMTEVGRLFRDGEYFVPEVLIAAEAMKAGTAILNPHLAAAGVKPEAKAVIGTVKGDLHDIGKNLVVTMFEGAGFGVIDLGVDVSPEKFIEAVKDGAQIVAMSALLTTTMPNMGTTIQAIQDAGLRNQIKVMVGGAPVTEAYAEEIGADGYSSDASSAARKAAR